MTSDDRHVLSGGPILSGIALSVTGRCALACRHCYASSGPWVEESFSADELIQFLTVAANLGIQHTFLGGGEPLLHPALARVVGCARRLGFLVSLSSNGLLVKRKILRALSEAGLLSDFSISIDGPDEGTNARLRGRGTFAKALRGMYELNAFGEILWGVNFVSCRPNLGTAFRTAQLAKRMGSSYFNLIRFTRTGRGARFEQELSILPSEFLSERRSLDAEFRSFGDYYGDVFLYDLRGDLAGHARSYFNREEFRGIPAGVSIDSAGDVYLTPASIYLGNARREGFSEIMSCVGSPAILEMYTKWTRNERRGLHQAPEAG